MESKVLYIKSVALHCHLVKVLENTYTDILVQSCGVRYTLWYGYTWYRYTGAYT